MSSKFANKKQEWTPVVGMKIRYRQDLKNTCHDPAVVATILNISEFDNRLTIERDRGKQRITTLSNRIWPRGWEPVPCDTSEPAPATRQLTEDDIRRIVREELASRAGKVESALRSFLDELFDAV